MIAVSATGGALAALGVAVVVAGFAGVPLAWPRLPVARLHPRRAARTAGQARSVRRRGVLLVAVPLVTLLVTGWPVAALFAAAATLGLPRLLGGRRAAQNRFFGWRRWRTGRGGWPTC